jgi:hypothetical protein
MPLKGEYTWTEKKDQLKISIPLKGVAPSKVDIFGNFLCFFCSKLMNNFSSFS